MALDEREGLQDRVVQMFRDSGTFRLADTLVALGSDGAHEARQTGSGEANTPRPTTTSIEPPSRRPSSAPARRSPESPGARQPIDVPIATSVAGINRRTSTPGHQLRSSEIRPIVKAQAPNSPPGRTSRRGSGPAGAGRLASSVVPDVRRAQRNPAA